MILVRWYCSLFKGHNIQLNLSMFTILLPERFWDHSAEPKLRFGVCGRNLLGRRSHRQRSNAKSGTETGISWQSETNPCLETLTHKQKNIHLHVHRYDPLHHFAPCLFYSGLGHILEIWGVWISPFLGSVTPDTPSITHLVRLYIGCCARNSIMLNHVVS